MPKATTLILPPGRSSIGRPESWPLPPDAARILARIAPTAIPVLCLACGGAAFGRIATSVHRRSGRARLERVDLERDGPRGLVALPRRTPASYLTLALDGLEHLDRDGQDLLGAYLDDSAPRLVCATRAPVETLAERWREDLLALLSTVAVRVPGLRDRAAEIPALAEERIAVLGEQLGLDRPPVLDESAAAALAAHGWPGDVTEFDAVLLATLLRDDGLRTISARHLVWARPERAPVRAVPPTPEAAISPPVAAAPRDGIVGSAHAAARSAGASPDDSLLPVGALESVAVELAHQLKNPLATVKAFVANAAHLGPDEMTQLREIALEGIDRIDAPLEQILAFSRLGGSTHEVLAVSDELASSLAAVHADFDGKGVQVAGLPPTPLSARGATQNLRFALAALGRHVAETIEPHSVLTVARPAADRLLLRYRESPTSANLRGATADPDSGFPLALLLVRGALVRMGGGLRTSHAQQEVTVELSFTPG